MKLEQQVVSLSLAKKLKELGVKQESAFAWTAKAALPDTSWALWGTGKSVEEWEGDWRVAAFTVAELGEMLPSEIQVEEVEYYLRVSHGLRDYWEISYCNSRECYMPMADETEAEARGLMLIYLIENKLISDRGESV